MTSSNMTFDELQELYRVEMNSYVLSSVKTDLYPAMRDLLDRLRREHERQTAIDPDSVMTEGADHRRKSAARLCREVTRVRATKICNLAFLAALGSKDTADVLTSEERDYYRGVLELSRSHMGLCEEEQDDGGSEEAEEEISEPPQADAPEPIPEAPSYHYDPNRPTEADVEAVRAVLRPIWTGVPYMAERSGLDAYIVRRACKALESRGEAVSKGDNGSIQYMRAPKAVQQVLPEPEPEAKAPRRQRARGCQKAVLASLGPSWTKTDDIVARVNERSGKEFARENVLDTLRHLAREGTIERYPPVVEGRRPLDVEWRVAP